MRDYQYISPSLEGIIRHASVSYEGIHRPEEVLRIMDGPAARSSDDASSGSARSRSGQGEGADEVVYTEHQHQIISQYFADLYGVFLKKLSHFAIDPDPADDMALTLQAMLQEMIKVKGLMGKFK